MIKTCSICNLDKEEESDFFFRKDTQKYRKDCKKCCISRANYKKDVGTRHNRKKDMIEAAGINCQSCEGIFPVAVYDFHHTDPSTKEKSPSYYLLGSQSGRDKILDNCKLLCANCHRIEHATFKKIPQAWLNE